MSITINQAVSEPLPQLIKQSATYKMVVPRKVEEKIRYLCRKFPTLEWSGVLFTRHSGNFEDGTLEIHCEDIYPMDLGSPGFTQFKMDETVSAYIAENIELFDCDVQLIHSHNQMQAFFSGQDQATLKEEGNDRNCFVSLIVNNAGTYCAAVTRKLQLTKKVTIQTSGISYEFFGEGKKALTGSTSPVENTSEETVIQYFMLDVIVEKVENTLAYLDDRFDEIEARKKEVNQINKTIAHQLPCSTYYNKEEEDDKEFYSWIHSERNKQDKPDAKEPTLFDEDTMDEMVDFSKWQPDPTVIHYLCCQLLTCSLIVSKDIDLKQWVVKHMKKKYDEIFEGDEEEFDRWADSMIEFIVYHYGYADVPPELTEDFDIYIARVSGAIIRELESYPVNDYIETYIHYLKNRAYE